MSETTVSADSPCSPLLTFHLLQPSDLPVLHALVCDQHIRRFLLDGKEMSESWSSALIAGARAAFSNTKLGMWLVSDYGSSAAQAFGFAGFWRFNGIGSAPQLVYALRADHAGRGLAGEIASVLVDFARVHGALDAIEAAVDEANIASRRVLERLGFAKYGEAPGAFGKLLWMRLAAHIPLRRCCSQRLLLRPFEDADLESFARLNADDEVMRYFPAPLARAESDAFAARLRAAFETQGFGMWALELRESQQFLGFTGLGVPRFESHFTPCVEIGWRLAREHWGQGYALEAARAALHLAFVHMRLAQVVAFTALHNQRSRKLMQQLGMRHDPHEDFDHPLLPAEHSLQRHVLYRVDATDHRLSVRVPQSVQV